MNATDIYNSSLKFLSDNYPMHIFWVCSSVVALFANIPIAVAIVKTKELHNKSHYIILGLSLAEIYKALAYIALGLYYITCHLAKIPATGTKLQCLFTLGFTKFLGNVTVHIFTLFLALDRFLCISFPVFYYALHAEKYGIVVDILCTGIPFLKFSLYFIDYHDNIALLSFCDADKVYPPAINQALASVSTVERAIAAFLYAATAIILYGKYKKANPVGQAAKSEWRRQMDFNVFLIVSIIGSTHLVANSVPGVLYLVALFDPNLLPVLLIGYAGFIGQQVASWVNLVVSFRVNSALRDALAGIFRCKVGNAVVSLR